MAQLIDLIGVPSEMGAQNGTSGGPQALRGPIGACLAKSGFVSAYHDLSEREEFPSQKELWRKRSRNVYRKNAVARVADIVAADTFDALCAEHLPVVFGGDHSVAMGSGRGALEYAYRQGEKLGLLWIDAHYDAHTEHTTQSHNANGMPLATLLGHGPRRFCPKGKAFLPEHVLHLGAGEQDCEPEERALLEGLGVAMVSRKQFAKDGLIAPWKPLKALLDSVDRVWVSLDLDAADQTIAPAVHLRNTSGLGRPELLWLAGHVANSGKLCGVDIMEYKPSSEEYDAEGMGKTAHLAADFLLRLLGK